MSLEAPIPASYSGVISIKQHGKALLQGAYGFADMANERPNRLDTRFVTASAGKAFTAAGILRLIEQGKLRFESALGELLPLDLRQIDPAITVRELLTHTSGIPDYCDETVVPNYADIFVDFPNYRIRKNEDFIPLFIDLPMAYPRGARFHYNNTGFVVLGLIIEHITDMPFDAYFAREVFAPCGMESTGYFEYDRLPANCATAYILDEKAGDYYSNIYSSTAKGTGDGGAFTTAPDVERFWQGLCAGKVISPEMCLQMTTPQVADGCYGYGMWLERLDGRHVPHFEGSEPGISFLSTYDRASDLLITLISNRGDVIWPLNRALLRTFYAEVPDRFYYGG